MEIIYVIIDDNKEISEHALLYSLEDRGDKVVFFQNPEIGLQYIIDHLNYNMIVLLDIEFSPSDKENGHSLLEKINGISSLIPVILWSGIDETKESFSDFINNHAFAFISKYSTIPEALAVIEKAIEFLKFNLDNVLEDWILQKNEDKDIPVYITTDGRSYSLNEIVKEIREQTSVGRDFSKKLNLLTIDLLLRNQEKLND
jgi:DNA-binding NtrC family response regulator